MIQFAYLIFAIFSASQVPYFKPVKILLLHHGSLITKNIAPKAHVMLRLLPSFYQIITCYTTMEKREEWKALKANTNDTYSIIVDQINTTYIITVLKVY